MKLNKKVVQCIAVLGLMSAFAMTAVTHSEKAEKVSVEKSMANGQTQAESAHGTTVSTNSLANDGVAGVSAELLTYQKEEATEAKEAISVEDEKIDVVASSLEGKEESKKEEKNMSELTPEQKEWQDKLMAKVDESLNVRSKASEKSDIVGKLYKGDRALIVKVGKTWTQIESGKVKGYVKNDYCVTGQEALEYAKKTVATVAKVQTDGLRLRSKASTDARVVVALEKGAKLKVDKKAKEVDGWVAVKYDSKTCFVSDEFVKVVLDTGKAITLEEEKAKKEAEEAAKNGGSSDSSTGSGTRQGSKVDSNADDFTLLSAIIMCEAGGESYACQLGVGAVVCNRVKSGRYPNSIKAVIYQKSQFGPASSGKLARVLRSGNISASCKKAARAALSGQDNTNGAIGFRYYRKGLKGVRIGCVLFFK
ncbi:MAG: cell wall hydrolase [Agathobacter sp.]|nr:cell wall hydrolase [Agathobacter sp.]